MRINEKDIKLYGGDDSDEELPRPEDSDIWTVDGPDGPDDPWW